MTSFRDSRVGVNAKRLLMALAVVASSLVTGAVVSSPEVGAAPPAGALLAQLGGEIVSQTPGDGSGGAVATSADGNTVIIGARFNDDAGFDAGHARVFDWDGSGWVQRGAAIDGEASYDQAGWAVAMSADGNTVIIGTPFNDGNRYRSGHARIFDWDGLDWVQRGADIDGEATENDAGFSVSMSADGNSVIIGARYNDDAGNAAGHARIFDWDDTTSGWIQRGADIDGEATGDQSGFSVAMSADGNTVIIGAPFNDDGAGVSTGHARIFDWNETTSGWVQRGGDIDGEAAGDQSGFSVAISSDGNTVIIGARYNDSAGAGAGHARILDWDGSGWVQRGGDIDGEAGGDISGRSVAMSADGDTVIIGAPGVSPNGEQEVFADAPGYARIFDWDGSNWIQRDVDIDREDIGDNFGISVAMSADGNTVIIGAPGQARVYQTVAPAQMLGDDIEGEANDQFGSRVAMSADGNSVIIGVLNSDYARIFDWNGSGWVQRGADIEGQARTDFGRSLAMSADGNTVVIGAARHFGFRGITRIFDWDGSGWVQRGVGIEGEATGDFSGVSVAMSADGNTVIIGAPRNEDGGFVAGHAQIFDWDDTTSGWVQRGVDIDGEAEGNGAGSRVAMSADGNTVIIGAPGNDDGGTNAGHARIFNWDGAGWTQRGADIDGEAAEDGSRSTVAMSADGNTVIIGAPGNDDGGTDAGHVRIFNWDGAGWVQRGADIDGEAAEDGSGVSVAMSADGNTVIIGAPGNDDGAGVGAGHARIFDWDDATSGWVQNGVDIGGESAGDAFGSSVAMSADGNTVIVGAPSNDGAGGFAGHARVFGSLRVQAPTVSMVAAVGQVDPTSVVPVQFTATFDQDVTGFDASGVTIGGTAGATSATVTAVSASVYTITVDTVTGDGTVTAMVEPNAATDVNGRANIASGVAAVTFAPIDVVSLTPARILESRPAGTTVDGLEELGAKIDGDTFIEVQVTGRHGVPTGAAAAILNVTAINPDERGFITMYPCDDQPLASSLNYPEAGTVIANEVITKLSDTGTVCAYTSATTHLAFDIAGYLPTGSTVNSLTPARILESRPAGTTVDGLEELGAKIDGDTFIEVQVTGRHGVPTGAAAAILNVTAINPDERGFITMYPCDDQPLASSLNYPEAGTVIANEVITKLSDTGTACAYTSATTHLAFDIAGYIPTS